MSRRAEARARPKTGGRDQRSVGRSSRAVQRSKQEGNTAREGSEALQRSLSRRLFCYMDGAGAPSYKGDVQQERFGRCLVGTLTVVAMVLLCGVVAVGSPKDEAKRILALRSAAEAMAEGRDALVKDAEGKVSVLIENELHEAMLVSPAQHAAPRESAALCRELVRGSAQRSLAALERAALETAKGHSPLPVTREALFKAVGIAPDAFYEAGVKQYVGGHAETLYKAARKRAVERQLRETSLRVGYPSQERADALLVELAKKAGPGRALKRADILKLEPRLQQELGLDKLPLFDEVTTRLRQLSLQVLGGVADQYASQVKAIEKAGSAPESAALVSSERIAPRLIAASQQAAQQERDRPNRDEAVRVYDTFTCVETFAQQKAVALEISALAAYATESGCSWPAESDVEAAVRSDISLHRDPVKSRTALADGFRDRAREQLATAYLAARDGVDRDALYPRMSTHLKKERACRDAFDQALGACVAAHSQTARDKIATEQAAPLLAELKPVERLSDQTIDWLSVMEHLHPFESLEKARAFVSSKEGLGASHMPTGPVLHEAEERLLARINGLLSPAAEAHAKQKSLILQLAKAWEDALKQDVAAGVALSELRKRWRSEVDARYAAFLEKRDLIYASLFPSNVTELEKILRQHYESLKQKVEVELLAAEKTKDATQEVRTEETPTEVREKRMEVPDDEEEASASGGGSGVAEMEEAMAFARRAAVAIVLRDVDDNTCELAVSYGELGQERIVRFEPGADDDVIATIVAGMDPEMLVQALGLERPRGGFLGFGRKRRDPVDVVVLAQSRLVRYRTMVRVRERLGSLLAERASVSGMELPEMEWSAASDMVE